MPDGDAKESKSDRSGRPKTTAARRIGIVAETMFAEACSRLGWVISKTPLESDFGIDFRVEPVTDRHVEGVEFYAQIKGSSGAPAVLAPSVRVASNTVNYWAAKLIPIAVVSVNIKTPSIHYGWFRVRHRIDRAI